MGSKIVKIATYLPDQVLSNNDLAAEFNRWEPEKIEAKLGIRERHIAAKNETAGDLALKAAKIVLENYDKEKIDMLIFCTQSPDHFLPATACLLQEKLGLQNKSLGEGRLDPGLNSRSRGIEFDQPISAKTAQIPKARDRAQLR